jgi:hypothetical protein
MFCGGAQELLIWQSELTQVAREGMGVRDGALIIGLDTFLQIIMHEFERGHLPASPRLTNSRRPHSAAIVESKREPDLPEPVAQSATKGSTKREAGVTFKADIEGTGMEVIDARRRANAK